MTTEGLLKHGVAYPAIVAAKEIKREATPSGLAYDQAVQELLNEAQVMVSYSVLRSNRRCSRVERGCCLIPRLFWLDT